MMALLSRYKALVIAAALLAAFCAGWLIQEWRLGGQISGQRAEHLDILRKTAEANAAVILEQQARRLELEGELAALDEQRYGELRHAQENTDRLAGELAAASKRLRVRIDPASCPAMPATANAGSLDDGAQRIDIHPADAAAIVRITGDADQCAVKLSALQDWARSVSR